MLEGRAGGVERKGGGKEIDLIVSDALTGVENAVCAVFPGAAHQFCVAHVKRQIINSVSQKDKPTIASELSDVFHMEDNQADSLRGYEDFVTFVGRWEKKYPTLRKYKAERNIAYFTYMDFPKETQRCIYTTNWIERLNRKYKRTISIRTAMPSAQAVIFLLGAVAMEETQNAYKRKIHQLNAGNR